MTVTHDEGDYVGIQGEKVWLDLGDSPKPWWREPALGVFVVIAAAISGLAGYAVLTADGPGAWLSAVIAGLVALACVLVVAGVGCAGLIRHSVLRSRFPEASVWTAVSAPDTMIGLRALSPRSWIGRQLPLLGYAVVRSAKGIDLYAGITRPRLLFSIKAAGIVGLESGAVGDGVLRGGRLVVIVRTARGLVEVPFAVTQDRLGQRRIADSPFTAQGVYLVELAHEDLRGKNVIVSARIVDGTHQPQWLHRVHEATGQDSGWYILGDDEGPEYPVDVDNYIAIPWEVAVQDLPVVRTVAGWDPGTLFRVVQKGSQGTRLYHDGAGLFLRPLEDKALPDSAF